MKELDELLEEVKTWKKEEIIDRFKKDYRSKNLSGTYSCDGDGCDCYACNDGCYISDC